MARIFRVALLVLSTVSTQAQLENKPPFELLLSDLDQNGDGKVEPEELEARIAYIREKHDYLEEESPQQHELTSEDIAAIQTERGQMDKDGDGLVDEHEVLAQFDDPNIGEDPNTGEDDNSVSMSAEELAIDKGYREAAMEMERMTFKAADANGDGKLDANEWMEFRHKVWPDVHRAMQPQWNALEVRQMMAAHDVDRNGVLDDHELSEAHDDIWYTTHPNHHDEL